MNESETLRDDPVDIGSLVRDDAISSRVYTDAEVFELELQRIWYRTWVYVGHTSEVAEPGDYVTRRIGRQPVIVSRDEDAVHVLLNRCSHRGNLVCQDERGNASHFRCAYHGWTFSNAGHLVGATFQDGFGESFSKDDFPLTAAPRVGVYRGFVFASLSEEGESLEDHLGSAAAYIDHFVDMAPAGEVRLGAGVVRHLIHGNWKMPVENATDGYHPLFLHRSCVQEFHAEGMDHRQALGSEPTVFTRDLGHGHAMLDFSEQNRRSGSALDFNRGRITDDARAEYRAALEAVHGAERTSELLARGLSNITIFPNLCFVFQDVRVFVPLAADLCEEQHFPALLDGAPEQINEGRVRASVISYGGAGFLGADDAEIYERSQMAFAATGSEWLNLRRGLSRQRDDGESLRGDASDETSQRGFWRRYRELMTEADT